LARSIDDVQLCFYQCTLSGRIIRASVSQEAQRKCFAIDAWCREIGLRGAAVSSNFSAI
jgi:hypothetical protein